MGQRNPINPEPASVNHRPEDDDLDRILSEVVAEQALRARDTDLVHIRDLPLAAQMFS